jgi:hypothetical protein
MEDSMSYDDMMGLEFGEFGSFLDGQMVKDALMASAAGGVAVLAGAYALNKLMEMDWVPQVIKDNSRVAKGVGMIALGYAGGRYLYNMGNEKASLGVLGGLGALGIANIINNFLGANSVTLAGDDRDESLLSNYNGMAALAALEATSVQEAAGAFSGLGDPTVTPEALMGFNGFDGTVVQSETLGTYAPYLS